MPKIWLASSRNGKLSPGTPNVDGLGLEDVGVTVGKRGIQTDARLRTSVPSIYAAGDGLGPLRQLLNICEAGKLEMPGFALVQYRGEVHEVKTFYSFLEVPPDEVTPDLPLIHLGLDSLLANELRARIQAELNVTLPRRLLLDGAGLATVTRRLENA